MSITVRAASLPEEQGADWDRLLQLSQALCPFSRASVCPGAGGQEDPSLTALWSELPALQRALPTPFDIVVPGCTQPLSKGKTQP